MGRNSVWEVSYSAWYHVELSFQVTGFTGVFRLAGSVRFKLPTRSRMFGLCRQKIFLYSSFFFLLRLTSCFKSHSYRLRNYLSLYLLDEFLRNLSVLP